jgi:autotransporter-associated beta strand protein
MLVGAPLTAATVDWNGNDFATVPTLWTTGANWVGGVAPNVAGTDDVRFDAANFNALWTPQNVRVAFGDAANSLEFKGTLTADLNIVPKAMAETLDVNGTAAITNTATGFAVNIGDGANNLTLKLNNATSTVSNTGTLNIKDAVTFGATSLTFSGAGTTTVSGALSGVGALIVNAPGGTVTLSGINSLGGGATLTAGTLNVNNASALGVLGLTINGGTLDNTAAADIIHSTLTGITVGGNFAYTGTKGLNLQNSGALAVAAAQTITVSANTLTLGGSVSAADLANIGKAGGGTLVLSGVVALPSPTYAPSITGGTLQFGTDQALAADQTITVGSGGTLSLGGIISGGFGLKKDGAGTLVLSNAASTYTGATTLDAGVLNVGTFANGGANSSIGAATNAAANLVLNGGTLQYTGGAAVTTDRLFTLGAGTVTFDSSSATAVNTVGFSNTGAIAFAGSGTRNLVLTGTNWGTGNNFEWNAGVSSLIAGVLADGPGGATSITKTGTGRWALTANNTYTGGTTVSAGQLAIRSGTSLGTGNVDVVAGAQLAFSNAPMTVANNITLNGLSTVNGVTGALVGNNFPGAYVNTLTGTLTLNGTWNNVSASWSDKSLNITGKVTGAGGLQIDSINANNDGGNVILSNATNDYAGGTLITGYTGGAGKRATLRARVPGALSSGTVTLNLGNLALQNDIDGTGKPESLSYSKGVTLTGDSTITVERSAAGYAPYYPQAANKTLQLTSLTMGANELYVANNNGYGLEFTASPTFTGTPTFSVANTTASNVVQGLTFSGQLTGTFDFNKVGTGTMVLANGTNDFVGTANVKVGVLAVASDAALGNAANGVVLGTSTVSGGSATTTSGNATVTVPSTAGMYRGMAVSGTGIPAGATIAWVNSPTSINISANATASGSITDLAYSGSGALAAFDTFATSRTITLNNATTAGNAINVVGGKTLTLNTAFALGAASNGLVKNDNGILDIAIANPTWTGPIVINAGAVRTGVAGALGSGTISVNSVTGAALQLTGGITVSNPMTLVTGSNVTVTGLSFGGAVQSVSGSNTYSGLITQTSGAASLLGADSGATLNITGGISTGNSLYFGGAGAVNVTTTALTNTSNLRKIGTGTTTLSVASPAATGAFDVAQGTFVLSGAGSLGGTGAVTVSPNATLRLDSSGTTSSGRLSTRGITLNSGTLAFIGNAANSSETYGALTLATGGGDVISLTQTGSGTVALTFASFTQNADSSFVLAGANIGTANNKINFTTAPTLVPATTGILARGITAGGGGFDFVSYNHTGAAANTNGLQAFVNYNPTSATNINSAAATDTVNVNAGMTTASLTASKTLNAVKLTGTGQTLGGAALTTLTLTSGGIANTGGANTINVPMLAFGATQAVVHVDASSTLNVNSTVTGTAGLVKADGGTLVLNPPANSVGLANIPTNMTLTGTHNISGGTLQLGVNNAISLNSHLRVAPGGTLDLNGKAQFVQALLSDRMFGGDGNSVEGAGGTVTGSAGSLLVANYDNTARQWAGTITGAVSFAREGQNTQVLYGNNDYTGSTLISGGTTTLRDGGRLSGTSSIDINYASLTLDNTAGNPVGVKALADRINDAATISLRGGTFTLLGRAQTDVTETVGPISLVSGKNVVDVQTGGTGVNSSTLTAASLGRPVDSTATVILSRGDSAVDQDGQIGSQPRMLLATAPTLSNYIIGPWAISRRDWVSYIPTLGTGRLSSVGYAGYATNTLTGSPLTTDNIKITAAGTTTLGANTTVNTLNLTVGANTTTTVDLGGNTLTLAGGGLLFGLDGDNQTQTVSNGTLTSGYANGAVNDLYVYDLPYGGGNRQAVVSAVIADNGGTPVRLVVTASEATTATQRLTLTGANTYTGGTVVNGGVLGVGSGGVIPAGGITLNNAMLDIAPTGFVLGTVNSANTLTLNGPAAFNSNGNTSLTLAGLTFNNEGGGSTTPAFNSFKAGWGTNGTGTLTLNLTGGITASSSNVSSTATMVGRFDFGTSPVTVNVAPVLVNGVSISPLTPALAVQGLVGSSGGIVKTGAGVLQLNAQQVFTGTLDVTAGGVGFGSLGNTGLSANNAAGSRFARINLGAGTFLNLTNTDATIGSLSGSGNVLNQAPASATSGRTFNVGFDGTSSMFSGSFVRFSDAFATAYQVNKIGGGTMTLTGVSNVTGSGIGNSFQVAQGGVTFAGSGSAVFAAYYAYPTGTLTLDNSTTNVNHRLTGGAGTGGTVNVLGGTFRIVGNASAATNETIGTLSFNGVGGPSTLTLEANAAQPLTLTVGAFGGQSANTALIRGLSSTTGAGQANLNLGSVGLGGSGAGGANGTTTMSIRPEFIGDASPSGLGTGFITKDTVTNFLRPLTAAELGTTLLSGTGGTTVNYGLSGVASIFSNTTINSLTLNSGGGLSLPSGLGTTPEGLPVAQTITSAGIIAQTGNAGINVARLASNNSQTFLIHTLGDLSLTGVLYNTPNGLTKADGGMLTLNSRGLYTGQTNVNGGTLKLAGGDNTLPVLVTGGLPTLSQLGISAGTLDLNGNNQLSAYLQSSARYANNGGTITNTSGTAATLTTNMNSGQAYGGTITGNLNFTKSGNNALTMTGASTYTGVTTVRANTLNLMDAGALSSTTAVNLYYGGLNLDNSGLTPLADLNPSRIPATAPVNLRGGTLTLTSGGSVDTTQTVNNVNALQAHNTISAPQAPISGIGVLTIGNLQVTPDATVNFTGGNGSAFFSGGNVGYNNSQVLIGTIDGAAIPATIPGKILGGWALVNNGEFATYLSAGTTGSNGLAYGISTMNGSTGPLGTYTQNLYDATTIPTGSNPTQNVRINGTGTQTIGAGGSIVNAVAVRAALTNLNFTAPTDVLNLKSGGLALTNGGTTVSATANAGVITAGGTPDTAGTTVRLYIHNTGTNTVNSTIANNTAGSANIVRLVANVAGGTLTLGGGNTYTGGTVVNGGNTLALSATGTIPAGGLTINNSTVTATTAVNQIASANDVTINGGGVLTLGNFANTLNSLTFNNTGGTATPTVTIGTTSLTLGANAAITAVNDNAATVPTIAGTSLILAGTAPVINTSTTAGVPTDLVISAPISTTAGTPPAIAKTGSGSLVLSGQSTFTGGVNLNAGTIILGANSTPTTGAVTTGPLGTGTLTMADGTALISDGTLRTVANAVALGGNVTFGSTAGVANASTVAGNGVTLNGTVNLGAATRTIDVNSFLNTTTLGGVVSGATGTGLTKTGPGTLVLSVANTFDGPVTINGGVLSATLAGSLGTATTAGSITFGGGILQHGGTNTNDYSARFNNTDQPFLIDTVANNVTYATALTASTGGSLGKFGTGNLTLTAAPSYAGSTVVNAGTLQFGTGLTSTGTLALSSAGLYDSGTFYLNRAATSETATFGAGSGSGNVVIDRGTLTFTGAADFGGALTFGNTGGTASVGALNLDGGGSFAGLLTVRTNSATANTIAVASGKTLTVGGGMTLGYDAGSGTGATFSNLTVSGAGSMAVTGATITVGANQGATNAAYWNDATLDVTALGSFSTNVTTFNIGVGANTQGPGTVLLSNTANSIVATTLTVGDTLANNGRGPGTLVFGTGTNIVQADTLNVGRGKNTPVSGNDTGIVKFASQTAGSPGTVTITNKAGTGAADITVGDNNGTATAGGAIGTLDLRGHLATVTANTLLIGRNNMGSNSGGVTGTVFFDGGTLTANAVNMAAKSAAGTGAANANLNISGGSFTVNTGGSFTLASQATAGTAVGTLNLTGGTLTSNVDILDGGGTATTTLTLDGGTLDMTGKSIGSASVSIDALNFQSGTLKNVLQINNGANLVKTTAGTLNMSGTSSYTGQTLVQDGTLTFDSVANVGAGSSSLGAPANAAAGTLAVGSGATGATLKYAGATAASTNRVIDLAGTTGGATLDSSGTGAIGFTSSLTATGAGSKSLTLTGTNTGANTLAGSVPDNGVGNVTSLAKTGAGTWILSGANTYTGATSVSGGRLTVTGTVLTGGATVGATTATLELARSGGPATPIGLDVSNVGTLEVATAAQELGDISGTGATNVKPSAGLTANSIVQDTLIIGAGGSVTIRETPVAAGGAAGANAVPEPATWALIGIGLLSLLAFRRRR